MHYEGQRQVQDVLGQSSFLSVSDRRLHFGAGKANYVDINVRWPSGIRQEFKNVASNRLVTIDEAKGIIRTEEFR